MLKSPWWIGHIPFAYELIGRLKPRTIVELGTYSGSSFAAFCQAIEACGVDAKCYGIDLWEGDIHMGKFDEDVYQEVSRYMAETYPSIAVLVRKNFTEGAALFADGSVDLLHIDGTHTYEAVSSDFHTWFPKLSDRAVVLFHDTNVTVENTGEPALRFGVRRFFDSVKGAYPHFEFTHCWGLGVLVVGRAAPPAVTELAGMARTPDFAAYFATKGAAVSKRFADMSAPLPEPRSVPTHGEHAPSPPVPLWHRAVNKARRILRRAVQAVRPA